MQSTGCEGASNRSSDQSRNAVGSSISGPTEKFCVKPMPGTANCGALGEWGCIMISLPSASGAAWSIAA